MFIFFFDYVTMCFLYFLFDYVTMCFYSISLTMLQCVFIVPL